MLAHASALHWAAVADSSVCRRAAARRLCVLCAVSSCLSLRVLTAIKERYNAAKTGHDLLKRKSDAIKVNLNNILKKILVVRHTRTDARTQTDQNDTRSDPTRRRGIGS